MRLIFVNRYYAPDESATSQLLADLAAHLAAAGWAVHVVASRQLYEDPAARLPARGRIDGVEVHRVWTSRFGRSGLAGRAIDYATFYIGAALALGRLARRGDIVVAKTDPPLISVVAALVARSRGARLVNWLQDVFPEVATGLAGGRLLAAAARLLRAPRDASLRAAAANVVLGGRMAALVRARGIPPARVAVIANWADGAALHPLGAADNPLRRAWGLQGRFVVGYSGNMGRAHDFSTILEAAERLRDEPGVMFLFVGGGHRKAWLRDQVRLRALPNVVFQPYQPREALEASLAVPDCHLVSLLPALEGLIVPSKVYGIAAVGRPILFVGDSEGEVAGLLREARCGRAVAVGDVEGLTGAILELSRSAALVASQGRNARLAFDERFDKPIALAAWDRLLSGLAGREAPSAVTGEAAEEPAGAGAAVSRRA